MFKKNQKEEKILNAKIKYKAYSILIQALKIMMGSSGAIFIAMYLNLEYATSAGIIALLTILTTKLETLRLSLYRVITYLFTVVLSWIVFQNFSSIWISYGIFIFIVVFISEWIGWKATISVNAVIGTHFLMTMDFSHQFIMNEFLIVLIGISAGIILNIFNVNSYSEKRLVHNMKYTELQLKLLLEEMSKYLSGEVEECNLWKELKELEENIEHFIEEACEHNNNTFRKEGDYYEHYFEMRMMQVRILHNFHYELRRMKMLPVQSKAISEYIMELRVHVLELNNPRKQIEELKVIINQITNQELPKTKEEFEGSVKIYHLLMDLEEFLVLKMGFVESVISSERYKKDYHNQSGAKHVSSDERKQKERNLLHRKKVIKKQK